MDKFIQCKDIGKLVSIISVAKKINTFSGARFYVCEHEGGTFALKMIQMEKPCDKDHTIGAETELKLLRWFRENIIDTGISPCIVELLYDRECKVPLLSGEERDIADKDALYRRVYIDMYTYLKLSRENIMTDRILFTAMEYCQVSLFEYIGWMIDDPIGEMMIKTLLFMIIYTLYAIDVKLPGTRHRDLHPGNIMLRFITGWRMSTEQTYVSFTVNSVTWLVPFYGVFPKLIDFGSAIAPDLHLNSCDEKKPIAVGENTNDMQMLLSFIYHRATGNGLSRTIGIINSLDTQLHHRNLVPGGRSASFPTLEQMLRNEIFTEFAVFNNVELQKKEHNIYGRYAVSGGTFGSPSGDNNISTRQTAAKRTARK